MRTRFIARAGMIAAIYAALTVLTMYLPFNLGWGLVQFRVSEALTVVACFTPAAIPGLTLGSAIANALNPAATWPLSFLDVVFGSLATAIGALWTWRFRANRPLALGGPVVANALVVPAYLPIILAGLGLYQVPFLGISLEGAWLPMYAFGVVAVGIGEAAVVYGLGWPLLKALEKFGMGEETARRD